MKPAAYITYLEQIQARVPDALRQGEAAAMSQVARTRVVGHQISGKGTRVRVQGRYAQAVAKRMLERAQQAAARAMWEAMQ